MNCVQIWRELVGFRRNFTELRNATEREIGNMKQDFSRTLRSLHGACTALASNQKSVEAAQQVALDKANAEKTSLEHSLKDKSRELQVSVLLFLTNYSYYASDQKYVTKQHLLCSPNFAWLHGNLVLSNEVCQLFVSD